MPFARRFTLPGAIQAFACALLLAAAPPAASQAPVASTATTAECVACKGLEQTLAMVGQSLAEVTKAAEATEADLKSKTAALIDGKQAVTPESEARARDQGRQLERLVAARDALSGQREKLVAALAACNAKYCRGPIAQRPPPPPPPPAPEPSRAAEAPLEYYTGWLDPPVKPRLPDAECEACKPAKARLDAAVIASREADRFARQAVDDMNKAQAEEDARYLAEYAAMHDAEDYAVQNGNRSPALDGKIRSARAERRAAQARTRDLAEVARLAFLKAAAASKAVDELGDALAICNLRCGDDVALNRVIGIAGNNPFDPSDPTGPKTGTGQPPVPGAIGSLQFSSASYGGGEGGAVLVMVMRVGGSAGNVSVSYATAPGTASQADFTAATGILSWSAGDMSPRSFSIALIDDTEVEQTESFTVALSAPTGGASLGSPATATITIADNDSLAPPQPAGAIQFSASAFSVAENAGSVTITATRTGGSAGQVTVQYFTGPSSAVAGSDYMAVNGVLTWGVGDMGAKSFNVPIINDTLVEGPETFFVTLNNPTGGATLGAPATATVTINDDDVNTGPCGPTGSAWSGNGGNYTCSGNCTPTPTPQALSVNGDVVTINPFHAGGAATFRGCSPSLTSTSNTLTYFNQSNHTATITRTGATSYSANIVSSGGGSCFFTCSRPGP